MGDPSTKPIVFSPRKPAPWWRGAAGISLIVSAIAAGGLGILSFAATRSSSADEATGSHVAAAPDLVQQVLASGKPTIIEFGANSCVSCREMKPILHALGQDQRIAVADIDILKERDYITRYQIRLMPTQVFYDSNGKEMGRHMGKISGEEVLTRLGLPAETAL